MKKFSSTDISFLLLCLLAVQALQLFVSLRGAYFLAQGLLIFPPVEDFFGFSREYAFGVFWRKALLMALNLFAIVFFIFYL